MDKLEYSITAWPTNGLPTTLAHRTRRAYDRLAAVYPLSTMFFHSRAHRCALEASGIRDGMRVLEVATGSGEMLRRILRANPNGSNIGVDLSPNMACRTQRHARRDFPTSRVDCQAVDARLMPFKDETFDAVVCCYLLELLSAEDILRTVAEIHRVLRRPGRLALTLIGQHTPVFNRLYKIVGTVAPAFWGRQVEQSIPDVIRAADFRIVQDEVVRQSGYPSRVLVARK
ncbi:MAG TPA: class I SAM-dependent methyltransferase [Bryobacteraceae bacterium]|nr:class I SAM-dependent methyltransferase [Bryobacteraceae bacterium]